MKCPLCDGECDPVTLKNSSGGTVSARRCTQCSGYWFSRPLTDRIDVYSISQQEAGVPNYSAAESDVICPHDHTLLQRSDHDINPHAGQYYSCPDCNGMFFPRGQLSLYTQWQLDNEPGRSAQPGGISQFQASAGIFSVLLLVVMVLGAVNTVSYQATGVQTLPTSGPNILTLVLLALTYLAGTVLAVLGRKLPVILLGWGVILVCLVGFSVIIFGP